MLLYSSAIDLQRQFHIYLTAQDSLKSIHFTSGGLKDCFLPFLEKQIDNVGKGVMLSGILHG